MLNPDVVKRLRAKIAGGETPKHMDGYVLNSSAIAPISDGDISILQTEPEWKADLAGPELIFGKPFDASCLTGVGRYERRVPEKRLLRIQSGKIIGNNSVLTKKGGLLNPSPVSSAMDFAHLHQANNYNHQGFVFAESAQGSMVYYAARETPIDIPLRVMFLHNVEPGNYGSFIFRQMPQMLFANHDNLRFDAYVVPDRTPWFIEALKLAGWPPKPIYAVREVSGDAFDEILMCNEFDSEGVLGSATLTRMHELAMSVESDLDNDPERIFVSRRLSTISRPNYRVMTNELEVEALAVRHGYSVVTPEALTFSQQMRLFRHARRIAGPSGSGMLNSAFSVGGTRLLDMESHHHTVRQHAKIYGSAHLEFSFLFGVLDMHDRQDPPFRRWQVPLATADEGFAWLST